MKNYILVASFVSLAAVCLASPEDELEAKLPEIFAKSAAHYKALDAAATPLMKGKLNSHHGEDKSDLYTPHGWNKWRTGKDEYDMRSIFWWTAGHFPGSLWYLYEATNDEFFKDRATTWTEILAPNSKVTSNHDIGFVMFCSYGNARRILKTDKYDALLVETADSLSKRYNEHLGLIRSWGKLDEKKNFLVIPDNLMNLELLEWAAGKGNERFAKIAESHADVTMVHHFRADGGCRHVIDYDQETKRVKEIRRGQGASCETAWSRGQSWGIYGYAMMYRATGFIRYLDFAKKLADYAMNHPNMPEDGVPYWDYGAPGEERDSSAASIMAAALIELSQYVGAADRDRYRAFAVRQLLSLASPEYFSEGNEIGHFLLKHGVGNKPGHNEIDSPLDYGDYYFLEALLRFRNLKMREAKESKAMEGRGLPVKAMLPKDELKWHLHSVWSNAEYIAKRALTKPIPETLDELYLEFWSTGNRSHYQKRFGPKRTNLMAMAIAEASEGKGQYLPRIEEYITSICDMKSWILPAHDWSCEGGGTFRGECITVDLVSSELAGNLACVVQMIGEKLKPETVARIKAECERRVFGPIRRDTPQIFYPELVFSGVQAKRWHWWADCNQNWNAVCWDGVVCAACGLIDDMADRSFFLTMSDKAADKFIKTAFSSDGYCSEGMGYWNYGFGRHLLTGRMLDEITGGKYGFFNNPKQRLIANYANSYRLMEGITPAFADGGSGPIDPICQKIIEKFWPDLGFDLKPANEFPAGQVWVLRDSNGLSVGFKGGHNKELHNHNDVGSYYLISGGKFMAGDPGGEVYTARTFSKNRYDSKVLNSYGHPVPVVGGKLQSTGKQYRARVISKDLQGEVAKVVLDITEAYEVKSLKKLTRTFVYDRKAKTFTVRDRAEFTEPTEFEDCYVTFGEKTNVKVNVLNGGAVAKMVEKIENPGLKSPHRYAWACEQPVKEAEIEFVFASNK